MLKKILVILILIFLVNTLYGQDKVRLIIRSDDIGSTHAANVACIKSYTEGITQSVELMVPCPWFEEAVSMLNDHPALDVGIHLVLTSEWEHMKWRPLIDSPGLKDKDGYFYPMIWPNENFGEDKALKHADWKPEEIENEFRAQIELALRKVPHISHLTCHMGCSSWDKRVSDIYKKLASEYNLDIDPSDYGVKRFQWNRNGDEDVRIQNFITALDKLTPGNYMFVEHPGLNTPEMRALGHSGYYDVAEGRAFVTKLLTDDRVKNAIEKNNIELISYKDLKLLSDE